ncbi:MAG: hypothetical protein WA159_13120 [Variovorax sp.]
MVEMKTEEGKESLQPSGWATRLLAGRLRHILPADRAAGVLGLLGVFLTLSFLVNHIQAYEDLWWPAHFQRYLGEVGFFKTLWMVLVGADMPTEYRTYAVSRLIHLLLLSVFGEQSLVFPLMIALTQMASSIWLLDLLRRHKVTEDAALATATIWLISPFLATWSFHRYSYLILPFQLVVATCLVIARIDASRRGAFMVAAMGVACALTGEMFLLAGPAAILLSALALRSREKWRLSFIAVVAMTATVVVHHLVWATFYKSATVPQRFEATQATAQELGTRTVIAVRSVFNSAQVQIAELSGFVTWKSLLFGLAVAGGFAWALRNRRHVGSRSSNLGLGLACGALACLALAVYLSVSILSGQQSGTMLRRYGYVSLTLLLICVVLCGNELLRGVAFKNSAALVLAVFGVASLSFSLHGVAIKKMRASDRLLISSIENARGPIKEGTSKGLLFYVAANDQYGKSQIYSDSQGPKMDGTGKGGGREEMLQSPFSIVWTLDYYSTRLMGFKFVGVPNALIQDGKVDFAGYDGPNHPNPVGKINPGDAVVVANLGFDPVDPLGKNVQVFRSFADFQPQFFSRWIERGLPRIPTDNNWLAIDLGSDDRAGQAEGHFLPDRKYSSDAKPRGDGPVERYGLIAGENSVYTHPNLSVTLPYYRSNRNGYFTYGVTFKDPQGSAEVALDFWEQWQDAPGRRLFEVEVSWDGGRTWASLGSLDLFATNGKEPFSLVLKRRGAKEFQFRTKAVPGSSDTPVILGLRVRKIA